MEGVNKVCEFASMSHDLIFSLIYNASLLLSLGLFYDLFSHRKQISHSALQGILFGIVIGGIAVVLMATPAHWAPGIIFDTRTILLGLTGLFFGPAPALTTMAIAVAYRLQLGGAGVAAGIATIVSSGLIGLGWRRYRFCLTKELSLVELYLFGLAVHVAMLACLLLLPGELRYSAIRTFFWPVMLIYPICTALLGNLLRTRFRRNLLEKRVQTSAELHRTILQTAMNGFWRTDLQGRLLEVNEAYCRMSGYTRQELVGLKIADLEIRQPTEAISDYIQAIQEQGRIRFESQHRRKDGTIYDVEVSAHHLAVEGGQCVAFLRDITERKRAEQELRASRKQYYDLVEGTPDLITRVDRQGRFLFVNHAVNKIFGLPEEDCIGRLAFDFIHPEDRERTKAAFNDWLKIDGDVFQHENRQISIDGQEHLLAWSIRAEHDDNGQITGFAGTARDVTEKRRAQNEQAKLEHQLQQVQKMESIGQLAGGIAHDFNNMLSVIIGHAELALNKFDHSHPAFVSLNAICQAADRSADLTRQLLTFARKQTIVPRVLDLNDLVAGMLKMLQRLIGENIQITWTPAPNLWPVKIDPSQFDQILTNLCLNARDAISGSGKITIQTENCKLDESNQISHPEIVPGDYVLLKISDNGSGIDNEVLSHIFEPFFTTKEVGVGTGLGLATVLGAVKQHGGYVYALSELGLGTTFNIYLPREKQRTLDTNGKELHPIRKGSETVLLVEDDPLVLQLLVSMLESIGYKVLPAPTGDLALSLAREYPGPIELLLSDLIMPGMNGKELSEKLHLIRPELKTLFISGYTNDIISTHGFIHNGIHLLQKPITLDGLSNAVRDILDAPKE